jgi:predicted DNA binding protein
MVEKGPVLVEKYASGVKIKATWDLSFPDKKVFDTYLNTLRNKYRVSKIQIITRSDNRALISTRWRSKSSSYEVVFKHDCLYVSPVIQKDGYEIYSLITERPREITKLMNDLEGIGEVKVFRVGGVQREGNPFTLTDKQLQALQTALNYNYYSWPRKITLQELAEIVKMKRRAFQENLRKAEAKVFPNLAKKALLERE